jgi:hypothetical protein
MDLTDIAMYCKIKQSEREADKYKQQSDLYESVLTGEVMEFVIPDRWTEIRRGAFMGCNKLVNIIFNNNITNIRDSAFDMCAALKKIVIPNSVTILGYAALGRCTVMTDLTIPNTIEYIGGKAFNSCTSLTNVTLGNNFNCNNLDLSASTKYSVDTLLAMLTALADRTGQEAYTLTLGATNLAKLILAKTRLQALLLPSAIESSLLAIVQCSITTRIGYAIICIKTS